MIITEKKSPVHIILAKLRKPGSSQEVKPEVQADESKQGLQAACEDMMQAIKDGSAADFCDALCAFLDQYDPDHDGDQDQDQEPEE